MEKKPPAKEHTAPAKKPAASPKAPVDESFRGIVRVAGKDVPGQLPLRRALLRIRGMGYTMSAAMANVIHQELKIDPSVQVGKLNEEQLEKIDAILHKAFSFGLPTYLFNHRNDEVDGLTSHLIMNDLLFYTKQDIEREKKRYSWRGYRHSYSQKVRGQRTRNTGRTGMAVGVLRKALVPAAAGAAAAAPGAKLAEGSKPAAGAAAPKAAAPAAVAPKPEAKPATKK